MRNDFSKYKIKILINESKKLGINKDLTERIYSSHLLGRKKDLVLHGGGNTSVKSVARAKDGKKYNVIYVKGSGSDLSSIEAKDFPAVKLEKLSELINKKFVTDEEMLNFLRKNLIDPNSPNPSVETLVHATIKEKFVDHTHSNAILEITNRKNGYQLCEKIFGKEIMVVPYIMPGFPLAKLVNQMYIKNQNIKGIILYRHGIFTFGESAYESYSRMIRYVSKAEKYLKSERSKNLKKIKKKKIHYSPASIIPIIRGAVSKKNKYILNFRSSPKILDIINSIDAKKFLSKGVVTPDHVIRIKPKILVINLDGCQTIEQVEKKIVNEVNKYKTSYINYFKKYNKPSYRNTMLDSNPQIVAVQHLGIFSIGRDLSNAYINGDVGEMAITTIGKIERKTSFCSISMKDIFDVEYWSLEQAKLKKKPLPLLGNITVITGGAGVIGNATAKKFKEMGSEVIILDLNKQKIYEEKIKNNYDAYYCDVRNRSRVRKTINEIVKKFGGIDILISNAGNALQHEIGTISDQKLKDSFDINFFSHQIVASEVISIMKKQKLGGCLLFNISKQSVNPGLNFGAYGLPKSALLSLCKQYALEYGYLGIRSNGINADRIESGLLNKKMVKERAKARNKSTDEYLRGNLLQKQVVAEDVANAFYYLSMSEKTTAAILSVDGGNIEASFR